MLYSHTGMYFCNGRAFVWGYLNTGRISLSTPGLVPISLIAPGRVLSMRSEAQNIVSVLRACAVWPALHLHGVTAHFNGTRPRPSHFQLRLEIYVAPVQICAQILCGYGTCLSKLGRRNVNEMRYAGLYMRRCM